MSTGYLIKRPGDAKRYVPIVRVSFHTADACYQLKGEKFNSVADFRSAMAIDPTMTVTSVTTTKSLGTPAGAFTIQLVGDEWLSKIQANDLVVIQMGYRKSASDPVDEASISTVMVGLVDTRRRNRSASANTVTTTITGRDFGKILLKDNLKFYPELGQANPDANSGAKFFLTEPGWITLMSFFLSQNTNKGTPAGILDNIIRYILPKLTTVVWTVWDETKADPIPKKVDITNILRYNLAEVNMSLPMILTADQYEGAVWNLMDRAAPKPFTELFVDVRESSEAWNTGDKPRVVNETIEQASDESKAIFPKGNGYYPTARFGFGDDKSVVMIALRNTPFDKNLWEKLYTHDLQAEDVLDEDLSISDNEHYNLFWAGTTINPLGLENLKRVAPPLWNADQVTRYGLSPLEVQIEGLALDMSDPTHPPLLQLLSKSFSAKLKAWYENNHNYMSGSMTVRGKGSYKIGQRLLRKGIGKEFYIESVSQTFTMFGTWTSALQVTRGMDLGSAPDHRMYLPKTIAETTAPKKPASQKSDNEITSGFYTVKSGDTLRSIAAKPEVYGDGTQWGKLLDANIEQLIERDSLNAANPGTRLYPGQVLRIPR